MPYGREYSYMWINYHISDDKIINVINRKLKKTPKVSKESCFKECVTQFGIMNREDFNYCWKLRNK